MTVAEVVNSIPPRQFYAVTLFPELFEGFRSTTLIGRAVSKHLMSIECVNPRVFGRGSHAAVDDAPYGGGGGMLMAPGPLVSSLEWIARCAEPAPVHRVLLSPGGRVFSHRVAQELSERPAIAFVCGRYEGVDARVREFCDDEISLGDFVLSGGEVAALAMIEAISRFIPGVLGNVTSVLSESHSDGSLEYAQYTRPPDFRGRLVPEALLSGDHGRVREWRAQSSEERTAAVRPDLARGRRG